MYRMSSIIAIDLGSNSLRILKMNCETKAREGEFHKTVKTADKLASTGVISDEAVERVVSALNEAREKLDFTNAEIKAVTTEAIRQAKNGDEVLAKIAEETAIAFEVIDGEAEAKYALLAVENRLKLLGEEPKSFMMVDIGGGSTELLFHYGEGKIFSKSFPLGVVMISQLYSYEIVEEELSKLMNGIKKFYEKTITKFGQPSQCILIGGIPTSIISLKLGQTYNTYESKNIHGKELKVQDLDFYYHKLLSMSFKDKELVLGIGRSELILTGILILKQLFFYINLKNYIVIDDGIREGVALKYCFDLSA